VCYRHNWVRNALAASLNRMPGVQAVLEPLVVTRRAPGDQRRGDIKVVKIRGRGATVSIRTWV
jgi:hypothetical protein